MGFLRPFGEIWERVGVAEGKETRLQTSIDTLTKRKIQLDESIKASAESFINQMESLKEKAKCSISEVTSKAIEDVDNARAKAVSDIQSIAPRVDEALTKVSEVSRRFATFEALKPLVRLMGEHKGEKHEVYPAMHAVLTSFQNWQSSDRNPLECWAAESLMTKIKEAMARSA